MQIMALCHLLYYMIKIQLTLLLELQFHITLCVKCEAHDYIKSIVKK
jgi:hypothetical protein